MVICLGLSDKAVVLATSKGCPRQIICFSPKHYAFQAHLEFDLEAIDLLIAADGKEYLYQQKMCIRDSINTITIDRKFNGVRL